VAFFICMLLCYIDESGTPELSGNTSHYILAGLAIPIEDWKKFETDIERIKKKYYLIGKEIHAAWILRKYLEQTKIPGFESLDYAQRRYEVEKYRQAELIKSQKKRSKGYKQVKKNYAKTNDYIHLTFDERKELIHTIALTISRWNSARLFAECIDKIFFDPARAPVSVDEQALEQIVSRFESYLQIYSASSCTKQYGLLIHDNNETVAKKHTELMKTFHQKGTFWKRIKNIIETPLFVNSELTSMIQLADVCSYAIRRYIENNESDIFDLVFKRGDRKDGRCVGIRHFTSSSCTCKICQEHK
ncbi:MAG: DUF3800 domain-containing protein, partial [Spirochaetales bacterium]|nr:DUF3800 domain-containing protein [Spirochaetales bacterium]